MRKVLMCLPVALTIVACTFSGASVPEPVHTAAPFATDTPRPTYTPLPTYTPRPTYTPQPTVVVTSESNDLETLFLEAQQRGRTDSDLRYMVEYYAPGGVVSIIGDARNIVDVGEDYVCLDDVVFDEQPPGVDTCIPYESIVRIRFTNTMFP